MSDFSGPSLPPELDPRGRAGRRRAQSRGSGNTLAGVALGGRILAALVSLAILVAGGFYWATYRNFTSNITRVQAIPARSAQPKKDIDGTAQNILIAGNDDRSTATPAELAALGTTEDGGSINTDTMMVLHIPADGKKAFAISFPRDSYVNIPGYGQDRLNAAYGDGYNSVAASSTHAAKVGAGSQLLIRTIENLTGITIDHFVMVDLISFYRISNAIGGVQVCLNEAAQDSYSGIDLPAGVSTIEGKQALAFVRQRHGLPNGDLDRIKRQQYFLSQAFRKISGAGTLLNPIKQTRLLNAISSSLTLDQGFDILKLAQQMQDLTAGNLTFSTIPTTPETINGADVLAVDTTTVGTFVKRALGLLPAPSTMTSAYARAKTVDPSTVTVSVLNGTGNSGVAGSNAQTLTQAGFKATAGDANSTTATTTIQYPTGMESQAKTLAQYVSGAVVSASSAVQGVVLTLGTDGRTASSSPASATSSAPSSQTNAPARNAAQGGCIN